jgi:hypothetical protein
MAAAVAPVVVLACVPAVPPACLIACLAFSHPMLVLPACCTCLQGGFADFKAAPGGAATWVYVLSGRQVVVLLPPTDKNRCVQSVCGADTKVCWHGSKLR